MRRADNVQVDAAMEQFALRCSKAGRNWCAMSEKFYQGVQLRMFGIIQHQKGDLKQKLYDTLLDGLSYPRRWRKVAARVKSVEGRKRPGERLNEFEATVSHKMYSNGYAMSALSLTSRFPASF